MATLGENLKKIRKAKKMTQKELAQKSGVKQSVISDLETGNAKSTGSILELANALGVTAEELKKGVNNLLDNKNIGFPIDYQYRKCDIYLTNNKKVPDIRPTGLLLKE